MGGGTLGCAYISWSTLKKNSGIDLSEHQLDAATAESIGSDGAISHYLSWPSVSAGVGAWMVVTMHCACLPGCTKEHLNCVTFSRSCS